MRRISRRLAGLVGVLVVVTAVALSAAGSVGARTHARAHSAACGVTVRAMAGEKVVINQYDQDDMHFAPGTITVSPVARSRSGTEHRGRTTPTR